MLSDLTALKTGKHPGLSGQTKIWIDLDNSPHVPFFVPIVEELNRRGYSLLLTVRDCFQVCELADLLKLTYKRVGRHYGKNKVLKLAGLCVRALQLIPTVLKEKPDLALSHGSRSQLLLSTVLGIPSLTICDYEFSKAWFLIHPSWAMAPDVIPDGALRIDKRRILKYPGIKEDVYVPRFRPGSDLRAHLGLRWEELMVTVRPPANEAHYHTTESDELFRAAINFLVRKPGVRIVLLPRNERQATYVRGLWPGMCATGKIVIPEQAVDGLNLIWHSDLVISGGGTMNREAAALGVPVYSIFRGKIGAVDKHLAMSGRLVLLESVNDLDGKLLLVRRIRPARPENLNSRALEIIVNHIVTLLESAHHEVRAEIPGKMSTEPSPNEGP